MADVNKAIEVVFAGVDDMSGTIAKIGGGLNDFTGDLQSVTQPLANVGQDILKLEAALVALTAGGLALATAKAGEFGDSFNEISTLIQAPTDAVTQFRGEVLAYSQDSTQSLEAINGAVYQAISATGDWENSLDLLAVSEKLAVGGVTDLESSTKLLATTLNAYGEGVEEAGNFSDVFFTIVKDGVTTIPELSTRIANVTALAANAGIPFETLGASISAMTGYGVNTAETMTQLKQAIAAMLAPTDATRAAADALGVDLGKAAIESKGFEVVLGEIYDAANGDLEIIKKIIPSIEGANAVMVLGADAGNKFADALVNQANNAGATEEAYKKMADNFSLLNQQIANNVNGVLIAVGDKIISTYGEVGTSVIDILQALSQEVKAGTFDELFVKINEVGGQLRDFLAGVAEDIPAALDDVDFSGLLNSVDELIASTQGLFQSFWGDLDLTTPEGLAGAIQKIVDSVESLNRVTQGIVEGLTPFVSVAGELLDKFNELDASTKELIGQLLGFSIGLTPLLGAVGTFGLAIQGGALAVGGLTKAFGSPSAGTGLIGSMSGLMSVLGPLVALWATWEAAFFAGTSLYENNTAGIRDAADATANWIGKLITGIDTEKGLNDVLTAGTNLTQEQIEAWKKRVAALESTPKEVKTAVVVEDLTEYDVSKMLTYIRTAAAQGASPQEILTELKAEWDSDKSKANVDWLMLEGAIKKQVEAEFSNVAEFSKSVDDALHVDETGAVSFPAKFNIDKEKLLTDTEQAALAAKASFESVGLDFNIAGLDEAVQKIKTATNDMARAAGVDFTNAGQHVTAYFDEATQTWIGSMQQVGPAVAGTITEPVKDEIKDLELEALKSKETIEKALELRAEVKVAEFEAATKQMEIRAETLQKALQLKAEVDIKSLENVGKTIDAIGVALQTSGDIITGAIGELSAVGKEFGPYSRQMEAVLKSINSETENRKKEVEQLDKLTEAQVAYLNAKTDALSSGDALIKVDADGLKPHLEAIWWEILQECQVKASENADDFLLGIG